MIESKECIKCKKTKIYTHFHASKGNIGGVHSIAKFVRIYTGKLGENKIQEKYKLTTIITTTKKLCGDMRRQRHES